MVTFAVVAVVGLVIFYQPSSLMVAAGWLVVLAIIHVLRTRRRAPRQ